MRVSGDSDDDSSMQVETERTWDGGIAGWGDGDARTAGRARAGESGREQARAGESGRERARASESGRERARADGGTGGRGYRSEHATRMRNSVPK